LSHGDIHENTQQYSYHDDGMDSFGLHFQILLEGSDLVIALINRLDGELKVRKNEILF